MPCITFTHPISRNSLSNLVQTSDETIRSKAFDLYEHLHFYDDKYRSLFMEDLTQTCVIIGLKN